MINKEHIFEGLVRSYHGDLYRYALFLSKDEHIAQDVVQEVYVRAWKNIHKLKQAGALKSWLFTILCRENARRFSRKAVTLVNIEDVLDLSSSNNNEEDLQRHQLQNAILQLPKDYREPILLQVIGGFSTHEISKILQLNDNTVSTRLYRARNQLKQKINPDCHSSKRGREDG